MSQLERCFLCVLIPSLIVICAVIIVDDVVSQRGIKSDHALHMAAIQNHAIQDERIVQKVKRVYERLQAWEERNCYLVCSDNK